MSNNNASDDDGAWPDDLFRKMKEGHDKFMRDLEQRPGPDLRAAAPSKNEQTPSGYSDRKGLLVVFKDLVDTTAAGFNDLAKNISHFPSNIRELRGEMQREHTQRREEEMDSWRRWTGHEASPDHIQMIMERASSEDKGEALNAAMCLVQESARRNETVASEKIKALFWEPSRPDPLGLFDMLDFDEANRWLGVEWFRRNAYSPVRLEAHPDVCTQGTRWREAFEDLLNVSLDKPMVLQEQIGERPNGNVQSTLYGPGLDWMLSLQCRGILPPQLPTFWQQLVAKRNRGSLQEQIAMYLLQKTQRSGNGIRQDSQFYDLVREISTPAPEQSFQPNMTACPMLGASAPETEQDLYDATNAHEKFDKQEMQNEIAQEIAEPAKSSESAERQYPMPEWSVCSTQQMEEVADALHSVRHEQWRPEFEDGDEDGMQQQAEKQTLKSPPRPSSSMSAPSNNIATMESTHDRVLALEQQAEALGFDKLVAREVADVPPRASKIESEAMPRVDVLSSLTTTQTTRLPNGTVTTKVMLKQRFADGREETHEKVHTYQEPAKVQNSETLEQEDHPRKKGWFWL